MRMEILDSNRNYKNRNIDIDMNKFININRLLLEKQRC